MSPSAQNDPLALSAHTRLLVVAPHPDDETIATGLLIQQVRAAGGAVRILLLTAGDNNPWPQRWLERRLLIHPDDRARWGRRRLAETGQALACLGVSPSSLQLLGWPDLGITDLLLGSTHQAVAELAAAIGEFAPSLLALPSLQDHHPDHGSAHVLVRLALVGHATPPPLLTYLVHGDASAGDRIEMVGSPSQAANKQAALQKHRSQMALSSRRLRLLANRRECYALEIAETASATMAVLPWQPRAWLSPLLQLSVVGPAGAQSWRWRDAPLLRDAAGRYHVSTPVATADGPRFARLTLNLPSPWIFDHWGWCRLPGVAGLN